MTSKSGGKKDSAKPSASKASNLEIHSLPHGKRIFDLNLSDRVRGVWDDHLPMVQQCTIEGVGIDSDLLNNVEDMRHICRELCRHFSLNIVEEVVHDFKPGATIVFILSESHLALHSWPDKGYVNIDLVTCSKRGVDPRIATDRFIELFSPSSVRTHKIYY